MRKKVLISILFIFTAVISIVNIYKNCKNKDTDLTLANLNAIAYGESFNWDGKEWNTTDVHLLGRSWKPVITKCTLEPEDSTNPALTFEGMQIRCNIGNGNCLIGTRCKNDL